MENLVEFLLENWQVLLSGILTLITVTIALVKGKKLVVSDVFKETLLKVLEKLPDFISAFEISDVNGITKKQLVITSALAYFEDVYGQKLTDEQASYISALFSRDIEKILGTPQKKMIEYED
jgi:uncharacterized protein YlzI (FlbEa/FlbD family)